MHDASGVEERNRQRRDRGVAEASLKKQREEGEDKLTSPFFAAFEFLTGLRKLRCHGPCNLPFLSPHTSSSSN